MSKGNSQSKQQINGLWPRMNALSVNGKLFDKRSKTEEEQQEERSEGSQPSPKNSRRVKCNEGLLIRQNGVRAGGNADLHGTQRRQAGKEKNGINAPDIKGTKKPKGWFGLQCTAGDWKSSRLSEKINRSASQSVKYSETVPNIQRLTANRQGADYSTGGSKNTNQRSTGVDQFRVLAAFMVIGIHTFPFSSIHPTLDQLITLTLFRVAVPFFMMITGYYMLGPYAVQSNYPSYWRLKGLYFQLLKLYGFSILLYLPISFYTGSLSFSMSVAELLKVFLLEGTFYHLWYFPALIGGVLLSASLVKKLPFSIVFGLSSLLYLIGLGGDSYYTYLKNSLATDSFYTFLFQWFSYTRNGLFYAPMFLVLGTWLYVTKEKRRTNLSLKLAIALVLLVMESSLLHRQPLRHDSMYLLLPLVLYFLLLIVLKWQPKYPVAKAKSYALWLYLLHPISIMLIYFAEKARSFQLPSLVNFLLVSLLSVALSYWLLQLVQLHTNSTEKKAGCHRAGKELHLNALAENLRTIQAQLPHKTKVMAVLKAEAYGHGALTCGRKLEKEGVDFFAVATLAEGILLRKGGLQGELLVLGYTAPDEAVRLKKYDIIQAVFSSEYASALNDQKVRLRCHLKIDTGMHRLGVNPTLEDVKPIYQLPYLACEGIFSHLGSADAEDGEGRTRTLKQIQCFNDLLEELKAAGISYGVTHLQSSYGLLNYPELKYDYVRTGIFLYGAFSEERQRTNQLKLQPILTIRAVLVSIKTVSAGEYIGYGTATQARKEMKIGVASIGYADGIPRELSGKGYSFFYKDYELPQLGMICMDMLLVDLTAVPNIETGDLLTIIEGRGSEQLAKACGTITNEVLSRLGSRLES